MFKFTIDSDCGKSSKNTASKKDILRSVPVEDAAIMEQFPLSEQDINQNAIGESSGSGKNG